MEKIRILLYEPYIFKIYGNTRYILSIFKYLNREKFEPILCSPFEDPFLDLIREMNHRVSVIEPPKRLRLHGGQLLKAGLLSRFKTLLSILAFNKKIISFIKNQKIDIMQCHSIRALLTAGLAAKLTGTPVFWYIKGELANPILDRIGFYLADKIVFQSEITKQSCYPKVLTKYVDKFLIIKNGIDLEEIESAKNSDKIKILSQFNIKKENINIAMIGQVVPLKGVDHLINAFIKVKHEIPSAKLYIIGDHGIPAYSWFQDKLNKILHDNEITEDVHFLGWQRKAQDILSLMDISVLPSLAEGVPKSVMEAMTLGKPIIATDVGGTRSLFEDGKHGFLIAPNSTEEIAKKLAILCKNKELRNSMGKASQEHAFKNFSIRQNIDSLEELYQDLITSP